MKKFIPLLPFLIILLLATSCSEDSAKPDQSKFFESQMQEAKKSLSGKSQAEKYEYLTKHLDVIRDGFLAKSQNGDFKSILYNEIDVQFDGDYNVLLTDLYKKAKDHFVAIQNSPYIKNGDFTASLGAFAEIYDENQEITLRPQIYIPNYQSLKEGGLLNGMPTLVSFNGDETPTQWYGVKLTGEGNVIEVSVDETYLKENEVWVISFNETNEHVTKPEQNAKQGRTQIINCLALGENPCEIYDPLWPTYRDVEFYRFSIDCLKENALSGKADLSIVSWTAFANFTNPYTGLHEDADWFGDADHRSIQKVDNSQLFQCLANASFKLIDNFNPPTDVNTSGGKGDIYYYILYEHDNWPASLDEITIAPNHAPSTILYMTFRSSQTEYAFGTFTSVQKCLVCAPGNGTLACEKKIDNGCAEFSFLHLPN